MASTPSPFRSPPKPVHSIPPVPGLPLLGNLLDFRKDRLGLQDRAAAIGPIARMSLANVPIYMITDADLAHQVLVDDAASYQKSAGLQFLRPLVGDGLLTAEALPHKRHRKLLAPAFAPKRLHAYGKTMVEETLIQIAGWRGGKHVDLAAEMMQLTLAIAGRTMFSADVRHDAGAVARGLELGMHAMDENLTSPIQLGYEWPLPRHRKMRKAVKILDEIVFRMIREARALGQDRGDVLSILLLAADEEGGLSDQQVRDEAMTLLLAGHETTANALTWGWFELGRNPAVRAKLEAEVATALQGRTVTTDDLPQLPYTLAVIEETLRLHPPAYVIGREAITDVQVGTHRLPAKSIVVVNIRGIHRRADYYPDPIAFQPERMLADVKKARPRQQYLPFGAGPRVCIGSHFALMEAQLVLATLVQQAKIRPLVSHLEVEPLVTLRPRGGLPSYVS